MTLSFAAGTGTNFIPKELTKGLSMVAVRAVGVTDDTIGAGGVSVGPGVGVCGPGLTSFQISGNSENAVAAIANIDKSQIKPLRFVLRAVFGGLAFFAVPFALTGFTGVVNSGRDRFFKFGLGWCGSDFGNI